MVSASMHQVSEQVGLWMLLLLTYAPDILFRLWLLIRNGSTNLFKPSASLQPTISFHVDAVQAIERFQYRPIN